MLAESNGGCGMSLLAEPVEELVKARVLADVNDPGLMAELSPAESAELGRRAGCRSRPRWSG